VISDLLLSEGRASVDPAALNMHPEIDRGALITTPAASNGYLRYQDTESGISPRALPGLEGYVHVVATDEHDEDGVLISDEFTNPHKRRMMVEKRARKMQDMVKRIAPPVLVGPQDAEVTLVGWGSTYGVINEAVEMLNNQGVPANHLQIKWIVPFHAAAVIDILSHAKRIIMVENNYSGQFARYLRSETGIAAHGHIRKYDGEPFLPHHIVNGVMELMGEKTERYVPFQEVLV
jgi:2-oxoglutarate ferredoxin oxidoreductase subunit alpha